MSQASRPTIESLSVNLERDVFLRSLIRELAGTLQGYKRALADKVERAAARLQEQKP